MMLIAGGEHVGFNNSMYLSERDTGFKNYTLAYYLRKNEV